MGNLRVMDTCSTVPVPENKSVNKKLILLKDSLSKDSVHCTHVGYTHMVKNIRAVVSFMESNVVGNNKGSAAVSVTGAGRRNHWRGFSSPVRSKSAGLNSHYSKWTRGKHRPVPYGRGPRGGKNFD